MKFLGKYILNAAALYSYQEGSLRLMLSQRILGECQVQHSIFSPSRSGIPSSPTLTFETSPYLLREEPHELHMCCI